MKTFTVAWFVAAVLFTLPDAFAQDAKAPQSKLWTVPLDNARIDARADRKAKRFKEKKLYKNLQYIQLSSVAEAQQDGVLSFTVPGKKTKYQAKAKEIRAEDKLNYTWTGELIGTLGEVTIASYEGKISAHINVDGQEYEIYLLEDDIYAMVERTLPDTIGITCPDVPLAEEPMVVEEEGSINGREIGCTPREVRVLILSTPNARARNPNIQALANASVAQFNQIQANSAVNGRINLVIAGFGNFNYVETPNTRTDVDRLSLNWDGNVFAQRAAVNADLVVCFTNGPYGTVRGRVDAVGGNINTAFAIVQVDFATNGYTFAHEVGHLYGAQHEDCAMWGAANCIPATAGTFDHGFNFQRPGALFRKRRYYYTLMHRIIGGDWRRVPNFSNPAVTYDTRATGTAEYDNAREIERTDQTVALFDPDENLTAFIDGPSYINLYTGYTWEAVYSCGQNYTFQWETSDDGFNYYSAGTSETMSRSVYNSSTSQIYLRVRVSSGGRTTTGFKTVYVNGSNFRDGIASADSSLWGELLEHTEDNGTLLNYVYPNPSQGESQISFYLPKQQTIRLDVIDLNGKLMQNVVGGDFEAGSYEFEVDHSSLSNGLYLYRLNTGNAILTKRLMIHKE